MINISHLHCIVVQRGCEAIISAKNKKVARNCFAYMMDYIVMKRRNATLWKGLFQSNNETIWFFTLL